jgi:hypothetical protein
MMDGGRFQRRDHFQDRQDSLKQDSEKQMTEQVAKQTTQKSTP